MRRVNAVAVGVVFALGGIFGSVPARAQTAVTAFEGARLIVGDGTHHRERGAGGRRREDRRTRAQRALQYRRAPRG